MKRYDYPQLTIGDEWHEKMKFIGVEGREPDTVAPSFGSWLEFHQKRGPGNLPAAIEEAWKKDEVQP